MVSEQRIRMRTKRHSKGLGRRRFMALCSAGAATVSLGRLARGAGVHQSGPRSARDLPADEAQDGARRILIVGDSMIAGGFGLFLARDLAKEHGFEVLRRGRTSSGLARPDFFDWMKEARRLTADFVPDATVVMFGGNDVQGLYMGRGEWIRWHEPGWAQEYARRVAEFSDIIAPQHQRIFWVGMPVMRPPKFHQRVQRVNWIYRAEMAIRPGGLFVDSWPVLADENGQYADRIVLRPPGGDEDASGEKRPKKTRVRAGDGIHLSPKGAGYLKDHVLHVMLRELG